MSAAANFGKEKGRKKMTHEEYFQALKKVRKLLAESEIEFQDGKYKKTHEKLFIAKSEINMLKVYCKGKANAE